MKDPFPNKCYAGTLSIVKSDCSPGSKHILSFSFPDFVENKKFKALEGVTVRELIKVNNLVGERYYSNVEIWRLTKFDLCSESTRYQQWDLDQQDLDQQN